MPLYPVYALLFADRGLSTAEVSSLFVIWSVVSFVAEIPSGALADTWSRRKLYAVGEFLTAVGYAVWIVWPAFPGFALGFVLWGVGGALGSGTLEALVYDELAAERRTGEYARIVGRGGTVGILAMLVATLVAAPGWSVGGYVLVGGLSVAIKVVGGLLALRLPESGRGTADPSSEARRPTPETPGPTPDAPRPTPDTPRPTPEAPEAPDPPQAPAQPDPETDNSRYFVILRAGVREATSRKRVAWAVLIAALVPGFSALDEYLPLLARDKGATTTIVPLLFAVTALAMAAGSALAGRYAAAGPRTPLVIAAVLLAGALIPHPVGMIAVSAAFGLLQFAMIAAETRLQDAITGPARTTVLSVAGFASEVFAVLLYGMFALPAPLTWLFALCAAPLLLTALAARR